MQIGLTTLRQETARNGVVCQRAGHCYQCHSDRQRPLAINSQ